MKYLISILFIIFLSVSTGTAGNQWKSEYDQTWKIIVTNCQGNTTVYKDCLIIDDTRFHTLVFMPNQGKIPSGDGLVIKVFRNACNDIIMTSE